MADSLIYFAVCLYLIRGDFMAYVVPDSTMILFDNVRIDARYENTIWFETWTDQNTYFMNKATQNHTFNSQSYQRKNRGYLRLQTSYSNVFNCSYMMYKNSSFENKWFFAFIETIEYINNNTVGIKYNIDVLQTYMFDYSLLPCFVEREHSRFDEIGGNVLPEDIPITDWKYTQPVMCPPFDPTIDTEHLPVAVVACTQDADVMTGGNNLYDGVHWSGSQIVYNALYLYGFHVPTSQITPTPHIGQFLAEVVRHNKTDGVIAIFMCPGAFVAKFKQGNSGYYLDVQNVQSSPYTWSIPKQQSWTYTYNDGVRTKTGPRNKKLYTKQFNKLIITDHDEASAEYAYEYFNGDPNNCEFKIYASINPNPEFSCIPDHYKGSDLSYIHQITCHGFPQCSWSSDAFQRWLAQNKYKLVGNAVSSSIGVVGAVASENPLAVAGAGINILNSVTKTMAEMMTVSSLPRELHGTIGQNVNLQAKAYGFQYYNATAINECLAMADDFFDMYGYKTCAHKIPNTHVRHHWTYTKTRGCIIQGSVPSDDAKKIEEIFDKGIRFWVNGDQIGNYALLNYPLPSI